MDLAPSPPFDASSADARRGAGLTWRAALTALALASIVTLVLFGSTAWSMLSVWARSDTFMHGFLIAPISAWLVWRMRDRLVAITPRPAYATLLPIVGACIAWFVGDLLHVFALAQFAFVAILVLTVPLMLGWRLARAIAFPLGFLFFMVPFGEFLLPPLMEATATVTVAALRASGVPVFREGLLFVIPSGSWSVVEACSGVRYLIASLVAGSLFAYLNYQSTRRRVVFCAVSAIVPVFANWMRAYMIVMIGHLSSNKLAVGVDHLIYGWVFFGIVLFGLYWAGSLWREPENLSRAHDNRAVHAGGGPGGMAVALPVLALFAGVSAIGPLAARALDRDEASLAIPSLSLADIGGPRWTFDRAPLTDWSPRFIGATTEASGTFANDGARIGAHVAYYRNQGPGRKLISSENVLVPSEHSRWLSLSSERMDANGASVGHDLRETILRRPDGAGLLVWEWYWIDGKETVEAIPAHLFALRERLGGRGDDGAAVIVYTPVDSVPNARARLKGFVDAASPSLDSLLRSAQIQR